MSVEGDEYRRRFQEAYAESMNPEYARLSVNIAFSARDAVKNHMNRYDVGVTETIRRAIALLDLYDRHDRVMIVDGYGEQARYREVTL